MTTAFTGRSNALLGPFMDGASRAARNPSSRPVCRKSLMPSGVNSSWAGWRSSKDDRLFGGCQWFDGPIRALRPVRPT